MSDCPHHETRRERGVIAQREYRKRHANKFKTLQDENNNLKDLIRDIVEAARSSSQINDGLQKALGRAQQVVGDHRGRDGSADGSRPSSQTLSAEPESRPKGKGIDDNSFDPAAEKSSKPTHSGDVYPPSTISPYLGDGMFTIAGRLFWDHMTYVNLQLQKQVNDDRDNRYDSSDHRSEAFKDYESVVAIGSARLDYYRRLNQPSCTLPEDADSLSRLLHRQKTLKENALARKAEFWKSPAQVAEMIMERTSKEEGLTIAAALSGGLGAHKQKIAGQRLAPYACNSVSFEDGPYWNVLFVSLHLGSYVALSAGEISPTTHPGVI